MIRVSCVVAETYIDNYMKTWTVDWVDHLGVAHRQDFGSIAEAVNFMLELMMERRLRNPQGGIACEVLH